MPAKSLPSNPSLKHLKYQAKDLLHALRQGNAAAAARTREFHPKYARMSDEDIRAAKLSLADAQLIVAREYGFDSWPKLKHHVEASIPATAAGSLSGLEPPAGAVVLRQKWPAGARIVRETALVQTMAIFTPGKPDPMKQELSLTSQHAFSVVKELPDGGREVELQHLSFRLEFDAGGYSWRFDSDRSSSADQSETARVFKIILGGKVRYFMDANNQVERMEGVNELVNRLNLYEGAKLKPGMTWDNQALDKVLSRIRSGARQPLDDSTTFGLKSMFNEDYFKSKLDPSFLPRQAVQPGDTWTFSRESRENKLGLLNANIIREYTVTFKSWDLRADRLCARLEFHGTEKTIPQAESETVRRIIPVKEGTFSGVVWFDPEAGRGVEVNVDRDLKITSNKLAMPAPSARPAVQAATDHYHVVLIEKLVSADGSGGS